MPAWLAWTLVALFSWGLWAVLSKLLGSTLSGEQSQALSTPAMLPILIALIWSKGVSLRGASRKGLWLALAAGIVTCLGNTAYYSAVGRGEKVATVVSLTALYPLITILLGMMVLRERLNAVQVGGVGLSIAAISLFNVQTDQGLFSSTVLYAVAPIMLWGLSGFLQKVTTNHLALEPAALVYLAAFIPVGLIYAVSEPWPSALTARGWTLVMALGFFLAFGNFAWLAACARGGKAAIIAPLGGLYPIISVPIAVFVLDEKVGQREVIGIICALASVAALSWETSTRTSDISTKGNETNKA